MDTRKSISDNASASAKALATHRNKLAEALDESKLAGQVLRAAGRQLALGGNASDDWTECVKATDRLNRAVCYGEALGAMMPDLEDQAKQARAAHHALLTTPVFVGGHKLQGEGPGALATRLASAPPSQFGGNMNTWSPGDGPAVRAIVAKTTGLASATEIEAVLRDTLAVIHGTGMPSKDSWRYQVIVPLSEALPIGEAELATAGLIRRLAAADIEAEPVTGMLLLPAAAADAGRKPDIRLLGGKCADIDTLVAEGSAPVTLASRKKRNAQTAASLDCEPGPAAA